MKKILLSLLFTFAILLLSNQVVIAQTVTPTPKSTEGVFGKIDAPAGVAELNTQAESASNGTNSIGLLIFISNMIKFASIIAGIWVMFNFVFAGFTYVSSNGDSGAYAKIGEKLSLSVTGLLLIVAAYTIIGVISLLVFGDATYIINPQIPTVIGT
ncbi:hypothetical protein KKI22_00170 [Patescibacteria group bacterium]|nr:hypothetical protein [Patescibacteria group bacterium]